ncbi:hypothetical protein ACFQMF_02265 [Halorubrum rutilum]|uniref:DUF8060 domain-containing protein n=1 Tax=Halorubrum rutilum TaxID=1364933 RepID=A0ABD6AIR6_9EURY|nr:hypothetical protein [Halorubrum rutilum]
MTGDERPAGDENGRTTDRDDDRSTADRDDDPPATQPMTDTDATATGESTATAEPTPAAEPTEPIATDDGDPNRSTDGGIGRLSTDRLRGILDRVGLAALVLLALIAGWGFYSQTGAAIRTWLDPAYQPIALAAFNLAILLVALAGVAHQLSRIRASE